MKRFLAIVVLVDDGLTDEPETQTDPAYILGTEEEVKAFLERRLAEAGITIQRLSVDELIP